MVYASNKTICMGQLVSLLISTMLVTAQTVRVHKGLTKADTFLTKLLRNFLGAIIKVQTLVTQRIRER
jgi:hypothetical protein